MTAQAVCERLLAGDHVVRQRSEMKQPAGDFMTVAHVGRMLSRCRDRSVPENLWKVRLLVRTGVDIDARISGAGFAAYSRQDPPRCDQSRESTIAERVRETPGWLRMMPRTFSKWEVSAARTRRMPSASPVTVYASATSGMVLTISRIRSGGTLPSQ